MSGIDIATATITLVEKSLVTYRAIVAARNFGSDAAQSVMMLRFEAFRYREWARDNKTIMAIFQKANTSTASRSAAVFGPVSFGQSISPAFTLREALCDAINQIIEVLKSVDKLLNKYGRAFEPREQSNLSTNNGVASMMIGPEGVSSEMHKASQKYGQLKQSLQSQTSFVRRIKYGIQTWNDADKTTLKTLTQQFKYWIDNLYEIAPPERSHLLEVSLASQVVGSARTSAQLETIQSAAEESSYHLVRRSANIKNIDDMNYDLVLKKDYQDLRIEPGIARSRRFITEYCPKGSLTRTKTGPIVGNSGGASSAPAISHRVLVEWYYYDSRWDQRQTNLANNRVKGFAERFSVDEKPAKLPVLDCIGWVQHPAKTDKALLYKIPEDPLLTSQTCHPITLHELLSARQTSTKTRQPSLGERFRLAAALAVGFLELHTVEWIHKGFGSHNVLLFYDPEGKVKYDKPFITGFDFARPDRPGEESLSTRPSKFDIYRHPDLRATKLSSETTKPASSRMHDVYSLGLVLFEIGMWTPLESYLKANLNAEDFSGRIRGYVDRDLALWMGDRFACAVRSCLSGEYLEKSQAFSVGEVEEQPEEEEEDLEDAAISSHDASGVHQLAYFYRTIVAEIHGCQCDTGER